MSSKIANAAPPATLEGLARAVAALAPPHLAESWDNVGLQIGAPRAPVRRAMTCLETTTPTIEEARRRGADAIVAHHPLLFRATKRLVADDPASALAMELIRAGLGLVVAHTNLDSATRGTNQVLAETCGLEPGEPLLPAALDPRAESRDFKFVVFVPEGSERAVIDAIHRGGGGRIGLYTHCTFRAAGKGTFFGGEGTNPAAGEAGRFEEVAEWRLEAVVPRDARASVTREVRAVHPYEEPAFDFAPLAGDPGTAGLGCMARPPGGEAVPPPEFLASVKRGLGLDAVRVSGPPPACVARVAICTGSGGSLLRTASESGADCFLTGEIKYHEGIEAWQRGLWVVEVGHFESERIVAGPLARMIRESEWARTGGVECFAASDDLQPFARA